MSAVKLTEFEGMNSSFKLHAYFFFTTQLNRKVGMRHSTTCNMIKLWLEAWADIEPYIIDKKLCFDVT